MNDLIVIFQSMLKFRVLNILDIIPQVLILYNTSYKLYDLFKSIQKD